MQRVIFALVLFAAALAQGQKQKPLPRFIPAPEQRFYLDLDSREGAYSQWRKDNPGTLNALRASVTINAMSTHARWLPSFSFWFASDGSKDADRVGVQLWSPDRKPPLEIKVVRFDGGRVVAQEKLFKTVNLKEKVEIEMFFVPPGLVVINVGDVGVRKFTVPWTMNSMRVVGSTGEMIVDPLDLGTVTP
jgi:hypothetical protein